METSEEAYPNQEDDHQKLDVGLYLKSFRQSGGGGGQPTNLRGKGLGGGQRPIPREVEAQLLVVHEGPLLVAQAAHLLPRLDGAAQHVPQGGSGRGMGVVGVKEAAPCRAPASRHLGGGQPRPERIIQTRMRITVRGVPIPRLVVVQHVRHRVVRRDPGPVGVVHRACHGVPHPKRGPQDLAGVRERGHQKRRGAG